MQSSGQNENAQLPVEKAEVKGGGGGGECHQRLKDKLFPLFCGFSLDLS